MPRFLQNGQHKLENSAQGFMENQSEKHSKNEKKATSQGLGSGAIVISRV